MALDTWGLFLEGLKTFLHPESHSKILSVMITKLIYSHIRNIKRGSPHTLHLYF